MVKERWAARDEHPPKRPPQHRHSTRPTRHPPAQELLSASSHYSEKARKSALIGLADLFARHPLELRGHVGTVYTK